MVVKELPQGAGPLLDRRQGWQTLLDGLSDGLRRVRSGLLQREVFNRTERTALPMLPGDDPCFMPTGLDTQDQAPDEDVPHFVGFGLGLGLGDKTLGQSDTHAGHQCSFDAQSVGWPGLRCLDEDGPRPAYPTLWQGCAGKPLGATPRSHRFANLQHVDVVARELTLPYGVESASRAAAAISASWPHIPCTLGACQILPVSTHLWHRQKPHYWKLQHLQPRMENLSPSK